MSANSDANQSNQGAPSGAAEEVRKAFSALPLGERCSTLFKVEIDFLGDVADTVISEASRALDEIADAVIGPKPSAGKSSEADQPAQ